MIDREQLTFDFEKAADLKLASIFKEALQNLVRKGPWPTIEASFYPYAGLSSTIRLRRGCIYVRVSDILTDSPPQVLYALACILVSKLYRLKLPTEEERVYRNYTSNPLAMDLAESARRGRGYKVTSSPRGKIYDLDEVFGILNDSYFAGKLERPVLSWSRGRPKRILGHHDHIHRTIIISRTLDHPEIPRFVLEYVLYHEMLHVKHPPGRKLGRTVYHSSQFRADERRFEQFEEATKWLGELDLPGARRRKRRQTRRSRG